MMLFIDFLRALAACLITNAHYTGIYPTDLIANGGLLGDVIFFTISGYCLYNIKGGFFSWYGKRIWRCYLPVFLITAIYLLIGAYEIGDHSLLWWFIYPTYYHFVASIITLYIPYFVIMRTEPLKLRIPLLMLCLAVIYLLVYVFFYDKTYYHIDTVREPFIRFLFMECMLLGAYFRQTDSRYRNSFNWKQVPVVGGMLVLYFASKLLFSRNSEWSSCQILNQVVLFVLLYFIFKLFSGLDGYLEKCPKILRKSVSFLAGITLEVYVVQYVLIDLVREKDLPFPINWLCLTGLIILAAFVLHQVCGTIGRFVIAKIKK